MKKKAGKIIIFCTFIGVCLSWGIWILLSQFIHVKNYEKRNKIVNFSYVFSTNESFSNSFDTYVQDNIPLSNNFVETNAFFDYIFFGKSINKEVVIGKEDWLFYWSTLNSAYDYEGMNLFSEEELKEITENCSRLKEKLDEKGIEFVIFIAPNKERIYNEFLPKKFGNPALLYRTKQLINYMRLHSDIKIIYPYEELLSEKEKMSYDLYYKTDTHWNYIGAYIGSSILLHQLGIEIPQISSNEISITGGEKYTGDLVSMTGLNNCFRNKDIEYKVNGYNNHNVIKDNDDFYGTILLHAENADSRRLYVIRDSFASYMAEYLGSQFSYTYMRHRKTYTYQDLVEQNPDIVVYETVERFIDELKNVQLYAE